MSHDEDVQPPTPEPEVPEGTEVPEGPGLPPPLPVELPRRPFPDTVLGALVLGTGAILLWLVVAQLIPGWVVIFGVSASTNVVVTTQEQVKRLLVEHLPLILGLGALFSVGLIWGLKAMRWLPAAPTPRVDTFRAKAGWTLLTSVACILGSIGIGQVIDLLGVEVKEQDLIVDAAAAGGIWFALAGIVAAPVGEELGFRRLLFSTLDRGAGRLTAYILTALLFAAVHGNPTAFPLYVWIAVCIAFAYEFTGSVWAAMFVHAANNAVSLLASGV
jgi:membrane protease YdiL (CAAX protease family)